MLIVISILRDAVEPSSKNEDSPTMPLNSGTPKLSVQEVCSLSFSLLIMLINFFHKFLTNESVADSQSCFEFDPRSPDLRRIKYILDSREESSGQLYVGMLSEIVLCLHLRPALASIT
jgi:hypothetical protein